jgi:predicted nucleotidyltransferase
MEIVTVAERKEKEAARRRAAAEEIVRILSAFAREHGGKFLVFGSAAKDRIGPDSDFDVIVDFPHTAETPAIEYVEDICRTYRIPADIHARSTTKSVFVERVSAHALVLG